MKRILSLCAILFALNTTTARAEIAPGTQELLLNASASSLNFTSDTQDFELTGGYGYFFHPMIEGVVKAAFTWGHVPGFNMTSTVFLAEPRFNLGDSPENAYFAGPFVGFDHFSYTGSNSSTSFIFGGEVGKRFQLGSSPVSWVPGISVTKSDNSSADVRVTLVSFSMTF